MGKALDEAVTGSADDGYTFQCPGVSGSPCGDPGTGQPFHSSGWPTQKSAKARGAEHFEEHKTGQGMTPLHEFRQAHGLVVGDDGAVTVEDL